MNATTAGRRRGMRSDIQALRALAVLAVLVFHLWPGALPSGYIGVDIFFVISGYLITGHLIREVAATGTVRLGQFWIRRIRRLMPAAITVIAASAVASILWVPLTLWEGYAREFLAALLYVENWALAADSVDYLASEHAASPVQHYWSLSVEEQFYVIWPVALLISLAALRRFGAKRAFATVVLAVLVLSFTLSVVDTGAGEPSVYFSTFARMWEFAVGGLLALLLPAGQLPAGARTRALVAWSGVAALAVAFATFDAATPFPGFAAALPVLATALILSAGDPDSLGAPMRWLRARPVQWIGTVSYSMYLWHWPLIVLAPAIVQRPLGDADLALLLVLTVVLAALTERWIERPFRAAARAGSAPASERPRRVVLALLAAMIVVGAAPVGMHSTVQTEKAAAAARQEAQLSALEADAEDDSPAPIDCVGLSALRTVAECATEPLGEVIPSPLVMASADHDTCNVGQSSRERRVCRVGAPEETALRSIALLGDSHAEHWRHALDAWGKDAGVAVHVITKSSCPITTAPRFDAHRSDQENRRYSDSCAHWNAGVVSYLKSHPDIAQVVVSASARNEFRPGAFARWQDAAEDGYRAAWRVLPDTVVSVAVIADVPRFAPDILDCVVEQGSTEFWPCPEPIAEAIAGDPLVDAASSDVSGRVSLIDMTDAFCDAGQCYPVVGRVLAYRDAHHISPEYSRLLAHALGTRVDSVYQSARIAAGGGVPTMP